MNPRQMNAEERGFRNSLWQATATEDANYPPLRTNREADVVIIGGGYTGLSSALHSSELGRKVVLLEAREIGWGASGRNGGQVNPGWKMMPTEIEAHYGKDRGKRICRLIDGACDLVFDLVDQHNIDCSPRRVPYFRAAYGTRGLNEVEQWTSEWNARGAQVSLKNQQETHQLMGSTFFHGGMEDARGGSLQPLSYCRGLARAATQTSTEIFTQSLVTGVNRENGDWQVNTQHGASVSAKHLVLATNGYTDGLWPGLNKQIVPVASIQAATQPLPKHILDTLLPQGHHFSDSRRMMIYCRIDETNRFQIGGRGSLLMPTKQQMGTNHLQVEARKIFPELSGVEWEFQWGGLIAATKNHVPHLIKLDDNAYAGLGYHGRGIAMSTIMGKQIAELIAGEDVPMPRENLSAFAFHKFRNFGAAWHMFSGALLDKIN